MKKTTIIKPINESSYTKEELEAIRRDWKLVQQTMKSLGRETTISYEDFLNVLGFDEKRYLTCVSSGMWRPIVLFKRDPQDMYINNYIRNALPLWRANMDIQPCLDAYAVVEYISAYMCKGNHALTQVMDATIKAGLSGNTTVQKLVCAHHAFHN